MKEKRSQWFIEPIDAFTNRVLSNLMNQDDIQEGLSCADGSRRRAWQCDYDVITIFHNNPNNELKFRVWTRSSRNSKPHIWKFESTARKR